MFREGEKGKDFARRTADQKEIADFLDKIFEKRDKLTLADYDKINKIESSEMLVSVRFFYFIRMPP